FFYCSFPPLYLHSFPTRRSSDLVAQRALRAPPRACFMDILGPLGIGGERRNNLVRRVSQHQRPRVHRRHHGLPMVLDGRAAVDVDRKSTRLNSSHVSISYAVFCL